MSVILDTRNSSSGDQGFIEYFWFKILFNFQYSFFLYWLIFSNTCAGTYWKPYRLLKSAGVGVDQFLVTDFKIKEKTKIQCRGTKAFVGKIMIAMENSKACEFQSRRT